MLSIELIPALRDNYAYFLEDEATKQTAVIDPSESEPVLKYLRSHQKTLHRVLNTHHHWDHTGGNLELKNEFNLEVAGAEKDRNRIPGITVALKDGDEFQLGKSMAKIIEIPGHTLGHIAFWFEEDQALFCGDTLFSLGCGRLFEGTPSQMFESLQKLGSLPSKTKVFCGHEYTLENIAFVESLGGHDKELLDYKRKVEDLRKLNKASIPSNLETECRLNPFLKAKDADEFSKLRELKDNF